MGLDPTTIGRYVVLGTLGQGAMGTVYLAEDPALKRGVALKVVNAGQPQGRETALKRFHREAEISARLNHPNVITVFDVGEQDGVGPFLAMEFIEGEGLDALIRRRPLAPQHALEILIQAASALEAAHALGIVHRDVKPSNLMVAADGRVKLMDFGIAKEEDQTNTTEALLCTPGYAAPEMLDGAKATAATDRWAFAVTAYECLEGKAPFEGESISVVLYNVAHGSPVFPEQIDPTLAGVFRKALAKPPGERYHDLPTFLADLIDALPLEESVRRRFMNHLQMAPEAAPQVVPPRPSAAPRNPHRLKFLAWTAGSLALAALLLLGWWHGVLLPNHFHVESEPTGAWVFAEGKLVARTPARDLKLPRRVDAIVLTMDGYFPYPLQLSSELAKFRLKLTPRYLFLNFDSRPSGAQIRVNDVPVGTTPAKNLQVQAVPHGTLIVVTKPGAGSWMATIDEQHMPPPVVVLTPTQGKH